MKSVSSLFIILQCKQWQFSTVSSNNISIEPPPPPPRSPRKVRRHPHSSWVNKSLRTIGLKFFSRPSTVWKQLTKFYIWPRCFAKPLPELRRGKFQEDWQKRNVLRARSKAAISVSHNRRKWVPRHKALIRERSSAQFCSLSWQDIFSLDTLVNRGCNFCEQLQ